MKWITELKFSQNVLAKTLNARNFLNIYRKILILDSRKHCFDSRNPTDEEFLQFHLTSSHNYSE